MTIEEIAKMAAHGVLINGAAMTCPERCLFYALKDSYARYKAGDISKAEGERLKQEAVAQFGKDSSREQQVDKIIAHHASMWQRIELAGNKYCADRTIENADAFMEAVYNVPLKKAV